MKSEAACHYDWQIASLDMNKAFLKRITYKELAEATGEDEPIVCFKIPPGSYILLRQFQVSRTTTNPPIASNASKRALVRKTPREPSA